MNWHQVKESLQQLQQAENRQKQLFAKCQSLDTALIELGLIITWLLREQSYQKTRATLDANGTRRLMRCEAFVHRVNSEKAHTTTNWSSTVTAISSGLRLRLTAIYPISDGWLLDVHLISRVDSSRHTRYTFPLPMLEPNDSWDRILSVDFKWIPPPFEIHLQLTRWMQYGQSVSLPLTVLNMELLPFASPTNYSNDNNNDNNNDDESESTVSARFLELKRQFNLMAGKSWRDNNMTLVDSQRMISISLTSLTEQLNRYKAITDGLLLNMDQIYCMLLALILGEHHTQ
ncbi:hypothetical protein BDF22DRAFT_668003 [Syncephalis plumigaleata]|nr:hypothetical protein BDF22DRAFT_668003 [Syncephalis plumigaleata]